MAKRSVLAAAAAILFYAAIASAAVLSTVEWYETATADVTENSATIRGGRSLLFSIACLNYDTNPKVVMLFDATSVPADAVRSQPMECFRWHPPVDRRSRRRTRWRSRRADCPFVTG
jgi:hypothetical protein